MSLMVSIQIKQKIAESRLGAVVTLAHLTKDGRHLIMVESGNLCIWDLPNLTRDVSSFRTFFIVPVNTQSMGTYRKIN